MKKKRTSRERAQHSNNSSTVATANTNLIVAPCLHRAVLTLGRGPKPLH